MVEININELDVFDDAVEDLTEEQKDRLIEREHVLGQMRLAKIPTLPCECNSCHTWIEKTDLHYIVGWENDKIICMECAEVMFEREDTRDD